MRRRIVLLKLLRKLDRFELLLSSKGIKKRQNQILYFKKTFEHSSLLAFYLNLTAFDDHLLYFDCITHLLVG